MIERIVIALIGAYITSQVIKTIMLYKEYGRWDWKAFFFENGGMPSTHTALTVGLTSGLIFEVGITYLTLTATLFTLLVMNDAIKLRKETEEEAKILNEMMAKYSILHRKLSEKVGHTPLQVIFGAMLGVFWALLTHIV